MRDPAFGHRDWFTGEVIGNQDEWTEWDYALVTAYQIIQDNTNASGILSWENESENVMVEAVKKIDKFEQSRQNRTKGSEKKPYKPSPGETWVPRTKLQYGEWPTYREWVEAQIAEEAELLQ